MKQRRFGRIINTGSAFAMLLSVRASGLRTLGQHRGSTP
jgi:hypothetical protein